MTVASNRAKTVAPQPRPAGLPAMEVVEGAAAIAERYAAHLSDESRAAGRAEVLAFPRSEADVAEALARAAAAGMPVTAASGRTGIVAGAVPDGGLLLSTERMDALAVEPPEAGRAPATANCCVARCGPGVTLAKLAEELGRHDPPLFFPPNPTETTAQVGGSVAANASGARSYRWGATRRYVVALRAVLACGEVLALERGEARAAPDGFEVELSTGRTLRVPVPTYAMPKVKNAAGYYAAPGMDLVDLLVGSEGTLGVITEATLALERAPESIISIQGFFPDEARALGFVREVRGKRAPAGVQAIEYFDGGSLALLAEKRAEDGPGSEVPETPAGAGAAVLVEVAGAESETESALETLAGLIEEFGGDSGQAWAGLDARERARLAAFRHALPEAVNSIIGRTRGAHPGLTKVGTDMAVPAGALDEMLAAYRRSLGGAALRHVIFGHIGDGHLHANVLPRDLDEYRKARALYLDLAKLAVKLGGTVSAEHGIGKLKKPFLELMYGPAGIDEMRRVKRALDPECLLGRGTMFDP